MVPLPVTKLYLDLLFASHKSLEEELRYLASRVRPAASEKARNGHNTTAAAADDDVLVVVVGCGGDDGDDGGDGDFAPSAHGRSPFKRSRSSEATPPSRDSKYGHSLEYVRPSFPGAYVVYIYGPIVISSPRCLLPLLGVWPVPWWIAVKKSVQRRRSREGGGGFPSSLSE